MACSRRVLTLLYYIFIWPLRLLFQGIFDALFVGLKLKYNVPIGRPVWRRPVYAWWSWRFYGRRDLPRAEIRRR